MDGHRRMEPGTQSRVVHFLPQPPHHIFISCFSGRDHFIRKRARDQGVHNLHHLPVGREHFRDPQLLVFKGEVLSGDDLILIIGAERGRQFVAHPHCQAIRKSMDRRNIDCYRRRVPLVDEFAQKLPLRLAINLTIGRVRIAIDGIQAAIGIAAECEPLQGLVRALIVEDIDGGASRGKYRG